MNSLSCLTNALHCKKKVAMSFMSLGKKNFGKQSFYSVRLSFEIFTLFELGIFG